MTPEPAQAGPAREAGPIVVAAAVVVVVALVAFMRIRVPGDAAGSSAGDLAWPEGVALQELSDPDLGLSVMLPADWERVFEPGAPVESDVNVVFRPAGTQARLALEAWDAATLAPFGLWLGVMAGDLQPAAPEEQSADQSAAEQQAAAGQPPAADQQPAADQAPNAVLAGVPAWVMWRAGDDSLPVLYAAYLSRAGRYLRITYETPAAEAGAARADDFRRVLGSVRWPEGGGEVRVPALEGSASPFSP